jgi:uncharacterized protein
MSDIRITNCHVHCFTDRHIPRHYPHRALMPFKRRPVLVRGLAALAHLLGQEGLAQNLRRLARFGAEARAPSQAALLDRLIPHYPSDTRFVVLPMAMAGAGHGPVPVALAAQHDELAALAARPDWAGRLIPFAGIDPRLPDSAAEVRRCIEELGFRGLKLYPRLGFAPDHPVLMAEVYPLLEARSLPVVSHCSRGGVTGRGITAAQADAMSAPQAFIPVLRAFPRLRVNLAHFGGSADWQAHVNDGMAPGREAGNWMLTIRDMIVNGDYPGLWTDISYTLFETEAYLPFLKLMMADVRIAGRVLFGSDYYMTRQEALSERAVWTRLRVGLGEDAFRQIAEINPEVWLGERTQI